MRKKSSKKQRFSRGFSLIEVGVISIILIVLVTLIIVAMQPNRAKGRDSKRVSEVNALRTALQLYYMDYGQYPTSTEDEEWCSLEQTDSNADDYCDNLITALDSYLSEIPRDLLYPREENGKKYSYQYVSTSSGEGYKLHVDLETREPYELYSYIGKAIAYGSFGGGGGPPQFIKKIGGEDIEKDIFVRQTSDNGYILVGNGDGYGVSSYDWLLVKFYSDMTIEWAKMAGRSSNDWAKSVAITPSGKYVVGGYTNSTKDFLIAEFDSDGDLVWAETAGKTGNHDYGESIAVTLDGNYYYMGGSTYKWPEYRMLVIKFPYDGGDPVWAKRIGTDQTEKVRWISPTSDGGCVATGYTAWGAGSKVLVIIKFSSSNGTVEWKKVIGGTGEDYGQYVYQTSDNDIIVIGSTNSYGAPSKEILLVKLDSDGNFGWAKRIGASGGYEFGHSVQKVSDGYIIGGRTNSFTSDYDLFLIKLDSNAENVEWAKTIRYGAGETAGDGAIEKTSDGGYIIAGHTQSGLNFDAFFAKVDSDGLIQNCTKVDDHDTDFTITDISEGDSGLGDFSGAIETDFLSQLTITDVANQFSFTPIESLLDITDICPE